MYNFLFQKLLLVCCTDFLQTWWEGTPGWEIVSHRPAEGKVRGPRSSCVVVWL